MGGFRPDFGDGGDRAIVRTGHRAIGGAKRPTQRSRRRGDWRDDGIRGLERAEAGSALRLLGVGDGAEGGEEFVELGVAGFGGIEVKN